MRPKVWTTPTRVSAATRARIGRFAHRDEGTFAVLSIFVFVSMLIFAGLAIDMMRHEDVRLRMQGASDRAVLAATMLRDNASAATPEQILQAYFAAEGLSDQLGANYRIETGEDGSRTITVVPTATVPSLFMRLVGVNDFAVATPARATESVGGGVKLELVMVLDVSGSMNGQGKIGAMRDAAVALTDTLLTGAEPGTVAITLVPYDTWVLPPPGFLNYFSSLSGSGACNDWAIWNQITGSLNEPSARRNCSTATWRTVHPYVSNQTQAETYINELMASGTTSIDLGVRYGALFFDPSIRPAISGLIANGIIDPAFEGRPYDWDEPNVVRALILLTDGQNCCGERYGTGQQDTNTENVCTELKDHGILVYTVAYQAPTSGANLMMACASSPSHYFNTNASGIADAFAGIASNIQTQALRLTL
ncbi:MAG TPA: VWA domain-containing protein [Pararhodobacter sp.]|uniref:pilus assembly protein TadG-related protein n=1 Tax=Pararhodobacter sp. TaxID=2127056 RepID=UPI001DBB9ED6|nr:pilus assembly protein TadG-related protein [Pararhodobacter sp.]MCB1344761.1 VWA domain-containing protein [Paracoccaceae bacterium]HPD92956.1 VWA domain-containing protein [Pararhodobacter sp.]